MKIGYPCINRTLECQGNKTFRLKSYSEKRLAEVVENNLKCLMKILEYNLSRNILFFRISSDLVPFASHPVCKAPWQKIFRPDFEVIGRFIRKSRMRVSMHPDQFTLINSPDKGIFNRSQRELLYHARVLDLMELDAAAKIQVHVGGVYGDKAVSARRFVERYRTLPDTIQRRLVIENDERSYSVKDCLEINGFTDTPVLFDVFHHSIFGSAITLKEALRGISGTWRKEDGMPMVDYSLQQNPGRTGAHAKSIDMAGFADFLRETRPFDFDVMLEIKDKEASALKAVAVASKDKRFELT